MAYVPKLPYQPQDGERISDIVGNIYQYQLQEDTWVYCGVIKDIPNVSSTTDGLVPPDTYQKITKIQSLLNAGISFSRDKIYIGKRLDNPYFYYFHSSDNLITFNPYITITNEKKLRIEINRSKLVQLLTRTPCIGTQGLQGNQGTKGRNGISADNEKQQIPSEITPTSIKVNASVETPINEDISFRMLFGSTIIFEILISINGTNTLTFINSSQYIINETLTNLTFNNATGKLTGQIFLTSGTFDSTMKFKVRQRGPQGSPGTDGFATLEIVNTILSDPSILSNDYVTSIRIPVNSENIIFQKNDSSAQIIATSLKTTVGLPINSVPNRYIVAVELTTNSAKDIGYYKFDDDLTVPDLVFPAWNPMGRCANRSRFAISNFNWSTQAESPPAGCADLANPLFVLEPKPPVQCCRGEMFLCGNLGDFQSNSCVSDSQTTPSSTSSESSSSSSSEQLSDESKSSNSLPSFDNLISSASSYSSEISIESSTQQPQSSESSLPNSSSSSSSSQSDTSSLSSQSSQSSSSSSSQSDASSQSSLSSLSSQPSDASSLSSLSSQSSEKLD